VKSVVTTNGAQGLRVVLA